MRSRSLCTLSNCRKAIVIVWFAAMLISTPAGVTHEIFATTYYNRTYHVTVYECEVKVDGELQFAIYRLVLVFAMPALLMSFFYARVIKALWISTKAMTAMTRVYSTRFDSRYSLSSNTIGIPYSSSGNTNLAPSNSTHSALSLIHVCPSKRAVNRQRSGEDVKAARKQVIKMLLLVIVLFMLCWGPKIILDVLRRTGNHNLFTDHIYNLQVFCGLLPFIHSCLNPVIYSMMSTNFGRVLRRSKGTCATLLGGLCSQGTQDPQGGVNSLGQTSCMELNGHLSMACFAGPHAQHTCHHFHPSQHHRCSSVLSTPRSVKISGGSM